MSIAGEPWTRPVFAVSEIVDRLIKAHAIPRKFFAGIRGTGNYSVLIDANKPLKAAGTYYQAGAYDNEILCEDCEKKFSDFDNYGWQILGNSHRESIGDYL
jgi:hypothetical protein